MTLDQGISLATSVAAFFSAIAALFAVYLSSKHSKASYKPELILIGSSFILENKDKFLKSDYLKEPKTDNEQAAQKIIYILLQNIGLGSAKEVQIKWSYSIKKMVLMANQLVQDSSFKYKIELKDGCLILESENQTTSTSIIWNGHQIKILDFVVPSSIDKTPEKIFLPSSYTSLISVLLTLIINSHKPQENKLADIRNIPYITIDISYLDIGNTKHKRRFSIKPNFTTISSEEVKGYFEILSQKN
ncbi:hypothetical protein P8629_06360 [Hydrogenovibrio sp. 3SP14C1]|uniref:hypothetical protein n=1 Tax=Hydrogenovibrio sp. 3SP14C1 TaxID=3038774 RepID=UPI002416C724|nr:hypothetical protein [Hydrogenovibrio sp. 3SP14C1]MDG4812627.1 hypothetical protein [Hydrogenovibrio sp. 3SP14C1]